MNNILKNRMLSLASLMLVLAIGTGCGTTVVQDVLKETINETLKKRQTVAISETEVKTLSEYIEDENYESAKWLLDDLYESYPSSLENESRFVWAVETATRELQYSHDEKLQAFIARYPDSLPMDFFSSLYQFNKGAKLRGTDWAANTSDAQFDAMRVEMKKSVAGFENVLNQHPESYLAHAYIGRNYSYIASRHESDIAFRKSLVQEPASFGAWNGFLWYNRPRWGGNYAGMMKLLNEMGYEVGDNPRLARLRGVILADKASNAIQNNKYDDAEELLMLAMDYGVVSDYTRVADELHAKVQASGDSEGACRISQKIYTLQPNNKRYKNLVAIC